MKTIKMVDGDYAINDNTGKIEEIESRNKASQDLAEQLLTEFNTFFMEGNELINRQSSVGSLTDALASQLISEAVNRLIAKQQISTVTGGRILKITQLRTRVVGTSNLVFLVEVLFSDGEIVSAVDKINIKPVPLNHLLDPGSVIQV